MQSSHVVSSSSSNVTIERLDSVISYEEFLLRFLIPNVPCVLPKDLILEWPAYKEWRSLAVAAGEAHRDLHPAFSVLSTRYGSHLVPIVERTFDEDDRAKGTSRRRENVLLNEAIEELGSRKRDRTGLLYIKDWHLVRQEKLLQQQQDVTPYTTPALFADDWMNNDTDEAAEDDFRFCYAGVAGTHTPLHRDVYTSYSWSTNIVGVKRWRLFPPSAKRHLRKYPLVETSELAENVDEMQRWQTEGHLGPLSSGGRGWPEWPLAMAQCHEVIQAEGETIFVPSDWHHEVSNLTDCISLNHNWCNSTNIASMYRAMCEEVEQVEGALDDVREMMRAAEGEDWHVSWTSTVQQIVESNAGWAWNGFWKMVQRNLLFPSCQDSLRPQRRFVNQQLLPCVEDFLARHDYPFLAHEVKLTAEACLAILLRQG